ncbi:Mov34/MPN/PAD-1 family protein [Parasphingorhabdus sp.]|uniref:Mov34/MPN/PAD-1 family protein n=1 Tax=Parasphingorhabdus sp. TaxID=2709688 RepID=UPI003A94BDAD
MKLRISSVMLAELQQLVLAAAPKEICGILFGEEGQVTCYNSTRNVADDPIRHFEIDPVALIAAERHQRHGGPAILGYYHSHPGSEVRPSVTDAGSAAADGRLWLILNGRDAAAWHSREEGEIYGRFDAIRLDCWGAKGQTTAT